jgi:maltose alpha-D-glucosyltransferase/alpha-amylase
MVTPEERQWMWEYYAPDRSMRLNLGIRRRLAPLLDNDPRKIMIMNSLLFTMGGSPFLYYGDEIGMGDDIRLEDRDGLRTPMQWENVVNAGFSDAPADKLWAPVISDAIYGPEKVSVTSQMGDPLSLFNQIRHMIAVRKSYTAFGQGDFKWIDLGNQGVVAYRRHYQDERFVVLNNLGSQRLNLSLPENPNGYLNVLDGITVTQQNITLEPFQFMWLLEHG